MDAHQIGQQQRAQELGHGDPQAAPTGAPATSQPMAGSGEAGEAPAEPPQGSLLLSLVLGLSAIGLGGLSYGLATAMLQPPADPVLPALLPTAPPATTPPSPARALGKRAIPAAGASHGATSLSLACLSGGEGERVSPADPSNFGPRLAADWQGRPVRRSPALIVLHETVVDESSALALFQRPHSDDGQQVSYHVVIGRDGRRIRVVPDAQRAFGAGDSDLGGMAVQLKPGLQPSVNNIALHVSLVSPPDGADGERRSHSGYTEAQYRSLASQIAQWQALYGIQASLVVTHQEVDRSGSRHDPRSFDWRRLGQDLQSRWLACGGSTQTADLGRAR